MQFLGAVTQSNPMMIVTEYLPRVRSFSDYFKTSLVSRNQDLTLYILQGDLRELLKRKVQLKPATAVRYALDIARYAI